MDYLLSENPKSRRYEKVAYFDEGQFALVYKARDTQRGNQLVAIKKVKAGRKEEMADGLNRSALREIKLLRELRHPNVIALLDVFGEEKNVNLVYEIMETDLEKLIRDPAIVLTPPHVKNLSQQLLCGLSFLHQHWVLHRDIKTNNLFISSQGQLKIGDFGLARTFGSPNRPLTNQVVTRWYKSPELLMGAKIYGPGIDIWSSACVIGEILLRAPLFPGDSDLLQLSKIYDVLGTPKPGDWPEAVKLSSYIEFKATPGFPLHEIFTAASDDLLHLLGWMLKLNPLKRCSAEQALNSAYFSNPPAPATNQQLPRPTSSAKLHAFNDSSQPRVASSLHQMIRRNVADDSGANSPAVKKLCY